MVDASSQSYGSLLSDESLEWEDKQLLIADAILGNAAAILVQRGRSNVAALLLSTVWASRTVDPEDQTFSYLEIHVAPQDRLSFTEEIIKELDDLCKGLSRRLDLGYYSEIDAVIVLESLPNIGPGWQEQLKEVLARGRPTNQAQRLRIEGSKFTEDGLVFTNAGELTVYRALKQLQQSLPAEETITVLPLPRGRALGHTWEPDVVVTYKGRAGVIEVDGPHHNGRRAMDSTRDHLLRDAGVAFVDRIPVEALDKPAELAAVLRRFLRRLSESR
ncbi:hypothetical protein ABH935_009843 [Catenulispora sp. GAS73]|uniref:hypothetical protein n=1 Tax=Catenulispora sp. GAS73 TaxID=3156269 RepID=UPI003518F5AE